MSIQREEHAISWGEYFMEVAKLTTGLNLNQTQFDALVDFAYNLGSNALAGSDLLANIKTNQGIIDYKYKMDEENNTEATIAENYLIGQVSVRPTEVAEFIDINFVLTSEV